MVVDQEEIDMMMKVAYQNLPLPLPLPLLLKSFLPNVVARLVFHEQTGVATILVDPIPVPTLLSVFSVPSYEQPSSQGPVFVRVLAPSARYSKRNNADTSHWVTHTSNLNVSPPFPSSSSAAKLGTRALNSL
jgi:hypothetical protein